MKTVFILSLFFFSLATATLSAQEKSAGKIVTDYFAWVDAGQIDQVGTILTEDFTAIAPFSPVPFDKMGWKGVGQGFKAAFPDMKHEIVDWFASGNKVAVKGIFKGTNNGPMMGNPATGNKVATSFTTVFELDGKGKIKSLNSQFDQKLFEAQIMAGHDPMAKTEANKKNVLAAYDALNRRDFAGFAARCTPEYTDLNVGPAPVKGIDACIEMYKQFTAGFPDFKITINEIVPASPTRFLLRVTITGTNTGSFMGIPATGKVIRFDDADVVELNADGKVISHAITNAGEAFVQIGYASMLESKPIKD